MINNPDEFDKIMRHTKRQKILKECRNPKTFSGLRDKLGYSSSALSFNLDKLIKENLIIKTILKDENGKYLSGKKATLVTNDRLLNELKRKYGFLARKKEKEKSLVRLLKQLNSSEKGIKFDDLNLILTDKKDESFQWQLWLADFDGSGLIEERYFITPRGQSFLKKRIANS